MKHFIASCVFVMCAMTTNAQQTPAYLDESLQIEQRIDDALARMTLQEKMKIHREYRESQYESLLDAVYHRRGWNKNGVPTIEHLKRIGMDLPELIEVVTPLQ